MQPASPMKNRIALWMVLLVALAARLYSVSAPLTDGGQERQTQVAMIARNLYRENLNVFYPRMDSFAPDPGYVTLEFPLQPALMAVAYHAFGIHDVIGRLITIAFSMGSVVFMYLLVSRFFLPPGAALAATAIYALTPMSIFFGRAVFPEALLLFFSLGALYFLLRWSEGLQWRYYGLSLAFASVAFLVKAPPGLVMILPYAAVWWSRWQRDLFRRIDFFAYFLLAMAPIVLWALWSNRIGPTEPGWNPYQLSAIWRWGIPYAWFSAGFYSWIIKSTVMVVLTPVVTLLSIVGLVEARHHRLVLVVYAWVVAMIAYVFLTPGAQMSHWNYQVPLIPIGALLAGISIESLRSNPRAVAVWRALYRRPMAVVGLAVLIVFGYGVIYAAVIRNAYDIRKRVPVAVEVGKIVQREIPNEGFLLLVQPNMVPAAQTYYMDRKVRQLGDVNISEVDRWNARGAVGVVAVDTPYGSGTEMVRENRELLAYLRKNFRTVVESDHYMIYAIH